MNKELLLCIGIIIFGFSFLTGFLIYSLNLLKNFNIDLKAAYIKDLTTVQDNYNNSIKLIYDDYNKYKNEIDSHFIKNVPIYYNTVTYIHETYSLNRNLYINTDIDIDDLIIKFRKMSDDYRNLYFTKTGIDLKANSIIKIDLSLKN